MRWVESGKRGLACLLFWGGGGLEVPSPLFPVPGRDDRIPALVDMALGGCPRRRCGGRAGRMPIAQLHPRPPVAGDLAAWWLFARLPVGHFRDSG